MPASQNEFMLATEQLEWAAGIDAVTALVLLMLVQGVEQVIGANCDVRTDVMAKHVQLRPHFVG